MMSLSIPPVSIPASDYRLLEELALQAVRRWPANGFLLSELRRATVCEDDELPKDVVRVNNWVTYRLDWSRPSQSRFLTFPAECRNAEVQLSVLSPEGAALLGLKVGERMPYLGTEGMFHVATVESLDPPPGVLALRRSTNARSAPRRSGSRGPFDPNDPGPTAA
jgi:regulator of nucleoside diphosphate kinase